MLSPEGSSFGGGVCQQETSQIPEGRSQRVVPWTCITFMHIFWGKAQLKRKKENKTSNFCI